MMMSSSSRLIALCLVASAAATGLSPLQQRSVDPRMDENCYMNTTGDGTDYPRDAPCYDFFEQGSVCRYNVSYSEKLGKPLSQGEQHECFCKEDGYFSAFAKCDRCVGENGGRYITDWIGSNYYSALSSSFCDSPTATSLDSFIPDFYSSYLATASLTSPSTTTATATTTSESDGDDSTTTPAATGTEPTETAGANLKSCGLNKPLLSCLVVGGALAML